MSDMANSKGVDSEVLDILNNRDNIIDLIANADLDLKALCAKRIVEADDLASNMSTVYRNPDINVPDYTRAVANLEQLNSEIANIAEERVKLVNRKHTLNVKIIDSWTKPINI